MKTGEITSLISKIPEGGLLTAEGRYDFLFLLALLDAGRAAWLRDIYLKDKNIPVICYQKFYPEYSTYLQPSKGCYAKFQMPPVLRLDEHSDGIRYVGSDDYDGHDTNAFDRVKSRAWLANYKAHPVMNPEAEGVFSFLYDGNAQTLELRGDAQPVKRILTECLFMHPLDINTFNKELDEYPLPMDGIYAVEKMIFNADTRIVEATTPKVAFQPPNSTPVK